MYKINYKIQVTNAQYKYLIYIYYIRYIIICNNILYYIDIKWHRPMFKDNFALMFV